MCEQPQGCWNVRLQIAFVHFSLILSIANSYTSKFYNYLEMSIDTSGKQLNNVSYTHHHHCVSSTKHKNLQKLVAYFQFQFSAMADLVTWLHNIDWKLASNVTEPQILRVSLFIGIKKCLFVKEKHYLHKKWNKMNALCKCAQGVLRLNAYSAISRTGEFTTLFQLVCIINVFLLTIFIINKIFYTQHLLQCNYYQNVDLLSKYC